MTGLNDILQWIKETGYDNNWAHYHRYHTDPEYRQKMLEKGRENYYKNPEYYKKYSVEWSIKNPKYHKEWQENNREKTRKYVADHYQKNKERLQIYGREYYWRKKNEKTT